MMIWNGMYFNFPSSYLMELISLVNDYVMMFLCSILLLTVGSILDSFVFKMFDLNYFEDHMLEFIWTLLPFIILTFLAVPSLWCLYSMESCLFCGLGYKVMGHQWYWSYFMGEEPRLNFDSYMSMAPDYDYVRLLEADNNLVVPVGVPVQLMVSSADVLHSWTIPSIGAKVDAIPGRVNQLCFNFSKCGKFFGQCSEICGSNHSFMPISVECIGLKDYVNLIVG